MTHYKICAVCVNHKFNIAVIAGYSENRPNIVSLKT